MFIVVAALCAGCGEGSLEDSNSNVFNLRSEVPEDKLLGELSMAEVDALNDRIVQAVVSPGVREPVCRLTESLNDINIFAPQPSVAERIEECNTTAEHCTDNWPSSLELYLTLPPATAASTVDLKDCSATVGQYEDCVSDILTFVIDVFSLDCAALAADSTPPEFEGRTILSARCEALQEECPEVSAESRLVVYTPSGSED